MLVTIRHVKVQDEMIEITRALLYYTMCQSSLLISTKLTLYRGPSPVKVMNENECKVNHGPCSKKVALTAIW